jgi:hypothetical protein
MAIEGMPHAGLCGSCVNAKKVETRRGSTFLLCQMSAVDPRFPRYPRLPVMRCAGWQPPPPASEDRLQEPGST